jgi:DNA-binding NtrC family response regulator
VRALPAAECEVCKTGSEAIERLQSGVSFQAAVVDHSVEPVNGMQLIRWVALHAPQVRVVMMTEEMSLQSVAMDAGAAAVLSTYKFSEIGEVLRELIDTAA